ncbi:hypothetical protein Acr_18g0007750 [Actinidia rufa]|uniref:Transmembrane protein n=1 Tax=Actinidia rufa TaxID=165716 RepID=A0A7J0G734_9ERIC|nr:hypothetical protein Acr_18g0007750 [Actinidia rufa]
MDSVKRKRGGKKKFFACFRPVAIDDEGSLKPDDPVIEFISVEGDEKMVLPKILTSLSEENLKLYSDGGGGRRMKKSRRSFSRILKAVLFKASLVKKVCRRKARQNSSPTKQQSERSKNVSNEQHEKPKLKESSYAENHHRIDSTRWPSLNYSSSVTASTSMCSSRASSVTTNSRSSSQRKGLFLENSESKQADRAISIERERGGYSSNVGLCLLLVSLLVLIVWGKVCAILCTSTWFFLVPRGIRKVGSAVNLVDLPEIDSESEGYKKRVIMEGLLQRNRSRVIPQVR